MEFGAVFWVDSLTRFTSAEVYNLLGQAERFGFLAWSLAYPTSALTHPGTLRYFNTSEHPYHTMAMMDADRMVFYNTELVHNKVMLPWLKCALDMACIAPPGAQSKGCHFNLQPKYLYTGCHKYDSSALNVVLGQAFDYKQPYIAVFDVFDLATPTPKHKKKSWFNR